MAKPQNQEMGVKMLSQLLRRMVECRRSCENRFQNKTAPSLRLRGMIVVFLMLALGPHVPSLTAQGQIGRASCRERVEIEAVDGRLERKKTDGVRRECGTVE